MFCIFECGPALEEIVVPITSVFTSSSSERYEVSTGAASSAQNSPDNEGGFPIRVNLSIYLAPIVTLRSLRLRFCLVVPLQSTQLQSISQLLFVTIFPFFTLSRTTC